MAHTCPECGMICHCKGDIDDCVFDFPEAQIACHHWKECEEDDDDIPDDYDPAEGEEAPASQEAVNSLHEKGNMHRKPANPLHEGLAVVMAALFAGCLLDAPAAPVAPPAPPVDTVKADTARRCEPWPQCQDPRPPRPDLPLPKIGGGSNAG
jgi:hypothetical protein